MVFRNIRETFSRKPWEGHIVYGSKVYEQLKRLVELKFSSESIRASLITSEDFMATLNLLAWQIRNTFPVIGELDMWTPVDLLSQTLNSSDPTKFDCRLPAAITAVALVEAQISDLQVGLVNLPTYSYYHAVAYCKNNELSAYIEYGYMAKGYCVRDASEVSVDEVYSVTPEGIGAFEYSIRGWQ